MCCRGAKASSQVRSSPAQSTLHLFAENLSLWELGGCLVSHWDSHQDDKSMCNGKNILCSSANFARAFSGEESNTVQSSRTKGYLDYLELEESFG